QEAYDVTARSPWYLSEPPKADPHSVILSEPPKAAKRRISRGPFGCQFMRCIRYPGSPTRASQFPRFIPSPQHRVHFQPRRHHGGVADLVHEFDGGARVLDAEAAPGEGLLVHPGVQIAKATAELDLLAIHGDR